MRSITLVGIGCFCLLLPLHADAGIIYSGPQNIMYSETVDPGVLSLFGHPGTWDDLRVEAGVLFSTFGTTYGFANTSGGNFIELVLGAVPNEIKSFSAGDPIGASNTYGEPSGFSELYFAHRWVSPSSIVWPSTEGGEFRNASGYAGIRMTDGADTYHGWIQVSVPEYSNANATGTLIDWAYEDRAGVGLQAGQISTPIPEPASLAMLGLGLGLAGLAARRRRKDTARYRNGLK